MMGWPGFTVDAEPSGRRNWRSMGRSVSNSAPTADMTMVFMNQQGLGTLVDGGTRHLGLSY